MISNTDTPDPATCLLLSATGRRRRVAARYLMIDKPEILEAFLSAQIPDSIRHKAIRGLMRLAGARDLYLEELCKVRGSPRHRLEMAGKSGLCVEDADPDDLKAAYDVLLQMSVLPEATSPESDTAGRVAQESHLKWLAITSATVTLSLVLVAAAAIVLY